MRESARRAKRERRNKRGRWGERAEGKENEIFTQERKIEMGK